MAKKRSSKSSARAAKKKSTKIRKTTRKKKKSPAQLLETLIEYAPPKQVSKSKSVAFSTHKKRAAWFNAREAWPHREVAAEMIAQGRAGSVTESPQLPGVPMWTPAGPSNIGGRMTALVVHPNDAKHLIAGAAGGGVWTSTNGGQDWTARWHSEPTLNIGSLCRDPSNPDLIYCGTGEANLSADSHPGVGIYRSMDGGVNWTLFAPSSSLGLPTRIGRIAVDPFNSNTILVGGVTHSGGSSGLFVSRDAGVSWAKVTSLFDGPYFCHEVVFSPNSQDTLFATIDAGGFSNGIWRSDDNGLNWTHLTSGLPLSFNFRRTSLAIAPSNPKIIYAQVATQNGKVLGIFRSNNSGDTWSSIGGNHFSDERQMNYNNTISVNPNDEDDVLCGGVDIHRTTNGGQTWKKMTRWFAKRTEDDYAHADQHWIVHAPNTPGLVYAMNDGGMDVSLDGGKKWENRSDGLATNMFYDIAVAATDGNMYGGGMQDNGTWLTLDGSPDKFVETTGGDGGFCAIDPNDKLHLYTSSQFMRVNRFRSTDGWASDIGPNETGDRPWMAFIALDPDRPKRVFVASKRVWRTLNDANTWSDVSGILDGSFITCIEIARADTDRIYVGTENGGIFRSDDGGNSWTSDIASSILPGRTITRLRSPAGDKDTVYASIANFGNSHLFRSTNGGITWMDVDNGNLPDVPHHGISIPTTDDEMIFVGGDAGVFLSKDAGATWHNISNNLPTTMVIDLVLHEATSTLLAATYGRSIWKMDTSNL